MIQFPDIRPGKGFVGTLDQSLITTFQNTLLQRSPLKLNIGAGNDVRSETEGWVNIDALPGKGIDIVANVEDLWMIPNECADEIYSCHVWEHCSYMDSLKVLKEWTRLLKIDGKIKIYVPDTGALAHLYCQGSWIIGAPGSERNLQNCVMGNLEDPVYGLHRAIFDKTLVKHYLTQCGYVDLIVSESDRGHQFELRAEGTKTNLFA